MPNVTKEQIEQAKVWDLLSYLQAFEPGELKRCGNQEYQTVTHSSLKISNGKWHWHSRGIGGKTALDYLIKVRGMDFVSAVNTLCNAPGAAVCPMPSVSNDRKPRAAFSLPKANPCGRAMVSYLQQRGIDAQVISQCIGMGILYESLEYKNCVFVGCDSSGKPRSAFLRGTYGKFKADGAGSDKRYSFFIPAKEKNCPYLAVTESPIDALSVASLLKMQGEDWTNCTYLCLGGTAPCALITFLHEHPLITQVSLCLDNDKAGLQGMENIHKTVQSEPKLSKRRMVIVDNPPPLFSGKDYNDLAQWKKASLRQKQRQVFLASEKER